MDKKMLHAAMSNVIADMGKHAKAARSARLMRPKEEVDPVKEGMPMASDAEPGEPRPMGEGGMPGKMPSHVMTGQTVEHGMPSEAEMEQMLRDMAVER